MFDDFNLHIPGGQRVGLVGMSGAGDVYKRQFRNYRVGFADELE